VHFRYGDGIPALRGVSLAVAEGGDALNPPVHGRVLPLARPAGRRSCD